MCVTKQIHLTLTAVYKDGGSGESDGVSSPDWMLLEHLPESLLSRRRTRDAFLKNSLFLGKGRVNIGK